jgi:RNA polymerase subunit RPABC4/transcription elongation factor Spt4
MQCPFCRRLNENNVKYCAYCGGGMLGQSRIETFQPNRGFGRKSACPACGSITQPGTYFCSDCGKQIVGNVTVNPYVVLAGLVVLMVWFVILALFWSASLG